MSLNIIKKPAGCSGDCGQCPSKEGDGGHSHDMPTQQIEGGMEGWKLATSAGIVFVFPFLVGLAGAFIAKPWGMNWQLGGFLAGVFVGVVIAKIISIVFFNDKNEEIKSDDAADASECPYVETQENNKK